MQDLFGASVGVNRAAGCLLAKPFIIIDDAALNAAAAYVNADRTPGHDASFQVICSVMLCKYAAGSCF
jgi:hypothetical protein